LLRELRLPPFDSAPKITLKDVFQRYQATLLSLTIGFLLLATGIALVLFRTNRMVAEAMLTKNGIGVDSVENGEQAVAAITNGPGPDLVLMDSHAATRHIRALEQDKGWPRLPIVALTAGAFAEEKEACLASGMDDFLAKPVDIRDLLAMIDQRINRKTP